MRVLFFCNTGKNLHNYKYQTYFLNGFESELFNEATKAFHDIFKGEFKAKSLEKN